MKTTKKLKTARYVLLWSSSCTSCNVAFTQLTEVFLPGVPQSPAVRADPFPSAVSVTGRRPPSTEGNTRAYPSGPGLSGPGPTQPSSPSEARCKIPASTNTVPDTSSCSKRVPLTLPLQPGPQPPLHLLSPSQKSRSGGLDVQQQTKWPLSFPWHPGMSFGLTTFSLASSAMMEGSPPQTWSAEDRGTGCAPPGPHVLHCLEKRDR